MQSFLLTRPPMNLFKSLHRGTQRLNRCLSVVTSKRPTVSLYELSERREKFAVALMENAKQSTDWPSDHLVIIPAAELQYMAYHIPYPFLQDSYFFYLTGYREPNAILALLISLNSDRPSDMQFTEHLFVEVRTASEVTWDGPTQGIEGAALSTGIRSTLPNSELPSLLDAFRKSSSDRRGKHLWYSAWFEPTDKRCPANRFVLGQILRFRADFNLEAGNVHNPGPFIDQLRFLKSPTEIQLMRNAAEVTAECLRATMSSSQPNMSEMQLLSQFEFESHCHQAQVGYPPVIAGGQRCNTIHYMKKDGVVNDGELILMDAGCRIDGYTADMTRTWPVNGRFTPIQRILYEILVEVQQICAQNATPESNLQMLHSKMLCELARLLVSERIIPSSDSKLLVQQICPHSVGHFLGLDIHDTPSIPNTRHFQPGVVFPLEPGVYLRPELGQSGVQKEFLGLGLRIEDDFVINEHGYAERLTQLLTVDPDEIESVLKKKPEGH